MKHNDFTRVAHRQLAKQDLIDQRKDGGVGADAKRERQHRDRGEARIFAEHAQAESNVLPEIGHPASHPIGAKSGFCWST
jgi:hypothetical protein